MIMHNHGEGGWGWPYDKQISFSTKWDSFKTKNNNFLLYIFLITIASIHFHGFPLDLSVVLLKLTICFFISGVCEQLLGQAITAESSPLHIGSRSQRSYLMVMLDHKVGGEGQKCGKKWRTLPNTKPHIFRISKNQNISSTPSRCLNFSFSIQGLFNLNWLQRSVGKSW